MTNSKVATDTAFRKELTSQVESIDVESAFKQRYGRRGWQRKLGAVLDVPETTVNGWFKSNKFPALATLAFGALLSGAGRPPRRWIAVRNGAGYAVCDTREPVGRIVANNIPSVDDALLLSAAPQLQDAARDAFVVFDDARDFLEDWGELADKLGAGLDAATQDRPTITTQETQDEPNAKQSVEKFSNKDRKIVIDAIQDKLRVELRKFGRRDKWRRDALGRNWWILGGDDWHGIPEEMIEDEEQRESEGTLVIAQKHLRKIDVYVGPLRPLIRAREKLYIASQTSGEKHYQFTVRVRGGQIFCVQAPDIVLEKTDTIIYADDDREQQ